MVMPLMPLKERNRWFVKFSPCLPAYLYANENGSTFYWVIRAENNVNLLSSPVVLECSFAASIPYFSAPWKSIFLYFVLAQHPFLSFMVTFLLQSHPYSQSIWARCGYMTQFELFSLWPQWLGHSIQSSHNQWDSILGVVSEMLGREKLLGANREGNRAKRQQK